MKRGLVFLFLLMAALCAALTPVPCLGEGAADYDYSVEITLANEGASNVEGPVPVPINALNLVSGGFLQEDGRDSLFTDSGHVAVGGTGQDLGQNGATWWWSASVPAGSSRLVKLFLGGPDAGHSLPLGDGDAVTVPDDSTLDVTTNLTVEASVILGSLPSAEERLLCKPAQYCLAVDASDFSFTAYDGNAQSEESYTAGDDNQIDLKEPWQAQTFTTDSTFWLDTVRIKLAITGSPFTLNASIRATNAEGKPTGSDLSTGTIPTGEAVVGWNTIDVSLYELQADTKYALVVESAWNSTNYISWRVDATDPTYTGGSRAQSNDEGVTWTLYTGYDFMFDIKGLVATSASVAASVGTHTVRGTADGTDLKLYVDGEEEASTAFAGPIQTGDEAVSIAFEGSVERAHIGGASVETPTWVLDLQFEPDQMAQTQEGTVGNGWEWTGTVQDQSSSDNDGTYSITRDTTDLTVEVGGLVIKAEPPPGPASQEYPDVVGDLPVGVIFAPERTISSPLVKPLREMAEESGMPSQAWWLLLSTIVSAVASSVAFRFLPSFAGSAAIGGAAFLIMGLMGHMDKWIIVLFGIWAVGIIGVHQYWGSGR